MDSTLKKNYINAAKWSTITEFTSKLVVPIINMILARLISPEAFGVVATVGIVTSFADMITDAGFQKFLVQRDFESETQRDRFASVAFWTNMFLSVLIWVMISLFNEQIAIMVGSPGLGFVIIISGLQVLLTAFTSIQIALIKRDFQFKKLFILRLSNIIIPFVITIPLALLNFSYWAIIIANLAIYVVNIIILLLNDGWRPKIYFSLSDLKEMFSFSGWTLLESFSVWITGWIDVFIIGTIFDDYVLGLYKTSTNLVSSIMSIITVSLLPVLFSGLSRLKYDDKFNSLFLKTQKVITIFILPMGVGLYLFSELATSIMLGDNWLNASEIIGWWSITNGLKIIFCNLNSEAYRAAGKPKLSLLAQTLHLVFLIPVLLISANYGFEAFVISRSLARIQFVIVNLLLITFSLKINALKILSNLKYEFFATGIMALFIFLLKNIYNFTAWNFIVIGLSIILYFGILFLIKSQRNEIINLVKIVMRNIAKKSGQKD